MSIKSIVTLSMYVSKSVLTNLADNACQRTAYAITFATKRFRIAELFISQYKNLIMINKKMERLMIFKEVNIPQ